ncbi:HNH endonuclease [Paracoccus halophilus]|nr:HNH endonuclease [Paracoccus halophilus]
MEAADDAMAAARTGLSRAQEFARRRMAASQYWGAIKRRRDQIKDAYRKFDTEPCKEARKRELEQTTRLPSRQQGEWKNADGSPALPGEGVFVPKEGTPMHKALGRHQQPVTGVPFKDGQPDLSGFPPLGRNGAAPDGKAYSVEIEQNLSGDRNADAHAAWEQRAIDYPDTRNPSDGQWHHTGDGVTMQYVDRDVHRALAHQGGVSMNTSPEF